ncbi:hypothetical protein [Chengkuizengella axinellae]|uniref:Uncharacterized protein n=1 Tax=Chengkuizengella axinellae TaxID=3064388 RepID=A0ABT9IZF5_9BACL|nr:hypothetical protein [Chengkuizengella sp. 2205SS18-9]MDP5274707.1 hypothetical protein [Chengkuizengella sp. 2205SS18-9]
MRKHLRFLRRLYTYCMLQLDKVVELFSFFQQAKPFNGTLYNIDEFESVTIDNPNRKAIDYIQLDKRNGAIKFTIDTKTMRGLAHSNYIYFLMIRDQNIHDSLEDNFFLCFYNVSERRLKTWLSTDGKSNNIIISTNRFKAKRKREVIFEWEENGFFSIYFNNRLVEKVAIGQFTMHPVRICIGENMEHNFPSRYSKYKMYNLAVSGHEDSFI